MGVTLLTVSVTLRCGALKGEARKGVTPSSHLRDGCEACEVREAPVTRARPRPCEAQQCVAAMRADFRGQDGLKSTASIETHWVFPSSQRLTWNTKQ